MRQLSSEPAEAGFSLPELIRCSACGLWLGEEDFGRDKHKRAGRATKCKGCDRARSKAYYAMHRERKIREYAEKRGPRLCIVCEDLTRSPMSRYCQVHADAALDARIRSRWRSRMTAAQLARARERERERKRAARPYQALIYNAGHRELRKSIKPEVDSGLHDCWRCGERIHAGELWHLGHVDGDPTRYAGPEHVRCNCATSKRDRKRLKPAKVVVDEIPEAVVEDCD